MPATPASALAARRIRGDRFADTSIDIKLMARPPVNSGELTGRSDGGQAHWSKLVVLAVSRGGFGPRREQSHAAWRAARMLTP